MTGTDERTRVCLLHTVAALPQTFGPLVREEVERLDVFNIVDESLLQDTIAHGMLPRTQDRVTAYASYAEQSGARAVLVTCSSIGGAAELARAHVGIPVYRVDEPMATEAVATGGRVGVLATLESTLRPTVDLIDRVAAQSGADSAVTASVCAGAFDALQAGDVERHDGTVAEEARRLAGDVDVLVLAQASMARVLEALPEGTLDVPVLVSPRSGVRQLRQVVPTD